MYIQPVHRTVFYILYICIGVFFGSSTHTVHALFHWMPTNPSLDTLPIPLSLTIILLDYIHRSTFGLKRLFFTIKAPGIRVYIEAFPVLDKNDARINLDFDRRNQCPKTDRWTGLTTSHDPTRRATSSV